MDRLVCGICTEELGSDKDVCCLPCGHVKHTACLREWCKLQNDQREKKCPNCGGNAKCVNFRKLFFDKEPNLETKAPEVSQEPSVQSGTVTNDANKQDLEKCKSELEAAHKRADRLEQSNRLLETMLHNSETELRRTSEKNREQAQELSEAQAKIRDLEAKLSESDLGQVIVLLKEKVGKLENGEIARLKSLHDAAKEELEIVQRRRQNLTERVLKLSEEVKKLSSENAKFKQELNDSQERLAASEKRNADANKERETMAERKRNCQVKMILFKRKLFEDINRFVGEMSREIEEPKAESGTLPNLTRSALVEIPPVLKKRTLNQEFGSKDGSAKKVKPNESVEEIYLS
ncbi:ring finger domain-containing protein [Ditylenchus destructor]|uniref:Ring finger domain-containing protein n=1 Tax=Ditylenchus destructor TaxID=166010 RepID=A0AAD4QZ81_9BILA|nr:ring finger domain-containing protein [Ditylenchus destructor]